MNMRDRVDLTNKENFVEVLVEWAAYRIRKNKNVLICICGGTGSGKSYAALQLADMIQQRTIKQPLRHDQIVFDGIQFMKRTETLEKGSVIIWDEIGVGLNSRRSMSNINIALNNKFQVFRFQNLITIFTTPDFGYIDVATRKLLHAYMDTVQIDFKTNLNKVKLLQVQNNPKMSKIYYHTFQVLASGGNRYRMPHVFIKKPRDDLIRDYENHKKGFNKELDKKSFKVLNEDVAYWKLTDRQREVWDLNQIGLNNKPIAAELHMKSPSVSLLLSRAERKMGVSKRENYVNRYDNFKGKAKYKKKPI